MDLITETINTSNKTFSIVESTQLSLSVEESSTIYIEINGGANLDISIDIKDGAKVELIYWNQSKDNMNIKENYNLNRDSYLKITYGELAEIDVERAVDAKLYRGSEILIDSASITSSKKNQTFLAHHLEGDTISNTNNYSIVVEGGEYYLDVIGEINHGAKNSKAFQESRILTTSGKQKATVLPQLLIYENDVEASHAATVGQIDENHLFYMQSRGMSEMEAMALVMSSYLMPIARAIENEDIANQIINLINKRVAEICFVAKQ